MSTFDLIVHHLQFDLRALTQVHFGPQAGAQLRGALWSALEQFACIDPLARNDPAHTAHCPMCRLVALESGTSARGCNPPRPFAIRPPLSDRGQHDRVFDAGDRFTFGLNLFGDATDLLPYVCQAVARMGNIGVGFGRGQFTLDNVLAVNPVTGKSRHLLVDGRILVQQALPVTTEQMETGVRRLSNNHLQLNFLTPMQLTSGKKFMTEPRFDTLAARLLERCQALELHYTEQPTAQTWWAHQYQMLTEAASHIQMIDFTTRWVRVESGSRRTNNRNAVGGFVGSATYEGELQPFLIWLLWGQSLHVGKNTVKGNGWYELVR